MDRLRATVRIAGLAGLLLLCAPPHLLTRLLFGRSGWPRRFLAAAGWICGLRTRVAGQPVRPHSLLVANHISWLDILALGGRFAPAFVSKDNLGHGLVHWLADQNRTIYVRRDHRKGAKDQALTIAQALEREQAVALFPEGTVGPGDRLLPFRPTLLESGALSGSDVIIRPVALDYGSRAGEISWHGEKGRDNVLRILGRAGTIPVTIRLLDPIFAKDRKQLAARAQQAISVALGFKSEVDLPIGTE